MGRQPCEPTTGSAWTVVLGFLPPTVLIAGLLVQLGWVREQTRLDHLGLKVRANLTVFEYMLNARPFALLAVAVFRLLALGEVGRWGGRGSSGWFVVDRAVWDRIWLRGGGR